MGIATTDEISVKNNESANTAPDIITHNQIWQAIDHLALMKGYSTSALAKRAGLDSTSLNKSKRVTANGRERWPSTESIAKILRTTNTPVDEFLALGLADRYMPLNPIEERSSKAIPLINEVSIRELSAGSAMELSEKLTQCDKFVLESLSDRAFAIETTHEISGSTHKFDEIAIIEPDQQAIPSDRVIVKTTQGKIFKSVLVAQDQHTATLVDYVMRERLVELQSAEIEWIARIAFTV